MAESNFGKQKGAERSAHGLPTNVLVANLHSASHIASVARAADNMGPDSTRAYDLMTANAEILCQLIRAGKLHT